MSEDLKRRYQPYVDPGIGNGTPVVATIPEASRLLSLHVDQLAAAVWAAKLNPWGEHANGLSVYRWPLLVELARTLEPQEA